MTSIRKLFFLVLAMGLTAFALPAYGLDKLFSLSASSLTLPISTNTPYVATWNNFAGNSGGNSVINSVKLDIPAGVKFQINGWTINNPGAAQVIGGGTAYAPYPTAVALNTPIGPFPSAIQIAINGFTGAKPGGTFVLTLTIMSTTGPTCTTLSKGYGWSGNTWGGTQYVASPSGADIEQGFTCTLACGQTVDNLAGDPTLGQYVIPGWTLTRSTSDIAGSCPVIPFVFTLDSSTNTANFNAIKPTGQILVEYLVVGSPVGVDPATPLPALTAGWTNRRPQLAWVLKADGVTPDFVPALACVKDDLTIGLAALPIIPNVVPFNTYPSTHPYFPGNTALMCIAQHGWSAVTPGSPPAGPTQIQYWDWVIDASDGWINQ